MSWYPAETVSASIAVELQREENVTLNCGNWKISQSFLVSSFSGIKVLVYTKK